MSAGAYYKVSKNPNDSLRNWSPSKNEVENGRSLTFIFGEVLQNEIFGIGIGRRKACVVSNEKLVLAQG